MCASGTLGGQYTTVINILVVTTNADVVPIVYHLKASGRCLPSLEGTRCTYVGKPMVGGKKGIGVSQHAVSCIQYEDRIHNMNVITNKRVDVPETTVVVASSSSSSSPGTCRGSFNNQPARCLNNQAPFVRRTECEIKATVHTNG